MKLLDRPIRHLGVIDYSARERIDRLWRLRVGPFVVRRLLPRRLKEQVVIMAATAREPGNPGYTTATTMLDRIERRWV